MMKISKFNPPALVDDFGSATLLDQYSKHVSGLFDRSIGDIAAFLEANQAGRPQFYNPLSHGLTDVDTTVLIPWNGFPRQFASQGPGQAPNYVAAEPSPAQLPGSGGVHFRPQDEYLEWFVHRDANGKIIKVDFTCEAYDYFEFLGATNKQALIALYRQHIDPSVTEGDLFKNGQYFPWNRINLQKGAMHLTNPANALGAEIKLAADATVRRADAHGEPTSAEALIKCARFGELKRNSDPKIGFEINQLARAGYAVTLTDPVGLYMVGFDDAGWQFADGTPAADFMRIVRGQPGRAIRAVYELPAELKAKGLTVSDVTIGGTPITFGGQIAEHITMGIEGAACRKGTLQNSLSPCGAIPPSDTGAAAIASKRYSRV
jgi:hypothetical protein